MELDIGNIIKKELKRYKKKELKISDKKYTLYVVPDLCDEDISEIMSFIISMIDFKYKTLDELILSSHKEDRDVIGYRLNDVYKFMNISGGYRYPQYHGYLPIYDDTCGRPPLYSVIVKNNKIINPTLFSQIGKQCGIKYKNLFNRIYSQYKKWLYILVKNIPNPDSKYFNFIYQYLNNKEEVLKNINDRFFIDRFVLQGYDRFDGYNLIVGDDSRFEEVKMGDIAQMMMGGKNDFTFLNIFPDSMYANSVLLSDNEISYYYESILKYMKSFVRKVAKNYEL